MECFEILAKIYQNITPINAINKSSFLSLEKQIELKAKFKILKKA